jgi:hypothetical protein
MYGVFASVMMAQWQRLQTVLLFLDSLEYVKVYDAQ